MAVFTATTVKRRSVAANVDAALKPNHPNSRMNVPSIAIGMLCAANTRGLPSAPYLPMRGPSTTRAGQRRDTAHGVHHAGAGEVDVAEAEVQAVAELASQPPPQVHPPKIG